MIENCNLNENSSNLSEGTRTFYDDKNSHQLISDFLKSNISNKCVFLCIGTDKYIGDCLGPIVGTFLSKLGLRHPVLGTLEEPVHAINLRKAIAEVKARYPEHTVVAIDASFGAEEYIGSIQVKSGCIHPGKGVGKVLPAVGDISIIGIVDSIGDDDYLGGKGSEYNDFFTSHNIRLNLVMKMAEVITKAIYQAFK